MVGRAISPALLGRKIVLVSLRMSEGPCRKVSLAGGEARECFLAEILRNNPLEIAHDRQ